MSAAHCRYCLGAPCQCRTRGQSSPPGVLLNVFGGPDWRPIETAPLDGTHVWLTNGKWCHEGAYSRLIGGCWVIALLDGQGRCNPTHWMPLPELPA